MDTKTKKSLSLLTMVLIITLSGCSRGLDRKIDLTGMDKQIQGPMASEISDNEKNQLLFAMANAVLLLGDNADGFAKGKTWREFIIGIDNKLLDNDKAQEVALQKSIVAYDRIATSQKAITLSGLAYVPATKDAFGEYQNPQISITIHNGSKFGLSSVHLNCELYLPDHEDAVADSDQWIRFEKGLSPGASMATQQTADYGFDPSNSPWDTLAVKGASQRTVKCNVLDAQNFDNKNLLPSENPHAKLEDLKKQEQEMQTRIQSIKS